MSHGGGSRKCRQSFTQCPNLRFFLIDSYPVLRLAPFSIATMPARAQKSALEIPKSARPSFWYFSSKTSTASSRPLFEGWIRLIQPLHPPTQLWNAVEVK